MTFYQKTTTAEQTGTEAYGWCASDYLYQLKYIVKIVEKGLDNVGEEE